MVKKRDNKILKEFLKFQAAFEVVEAFPAKFNNVKIDLELSIAEAVNKSNIYYTTWMTKALKIPPLKDLLSFLEKNSSSIIT